MMYRVIKEGRHPITAQPLKRGMVIDLFHTIGDPLMKGKEPLLTRTKKIDPKTAMTLKNKIEEELQ